MLAWLAGVNWQMVSAFAQAVLAVAALVALSQLRQSALARNAQLLIWADEQIGSLHEDLAVIRDAPRFPIVSAVLAPGFETPWDSSQEAAAWRISKTLQQIGYFTSLVCFPNDTSYERGRVL